MDKGERMTVGTNLRRDMSRRVMMMGAAAVTAWATSPARALLQQASGRATALPA